MHPFYGIPDTVDLMVFKENGLRQFKFNHARRNMILLCKIREPFQEILFRKMLSGQVDGNRDHCRIHGSRNRRRRIQ